MFKFLALVLLLTPGSFSQTGMSLRQVDRPMTTEVADDDEIAIIDQSADPSTYSLWKKNRYTTIEDLFRGRGAGLNQTQVDARISPWARVGNTDKIPGSKLRTVDQTKDLLDGAIDEDSIKPNLTDEEKTAFRNKIGAGTGSGGGTELTDSQTRFLAEGSVVTQFSEVPNLADIGINNNIGYATTTSPGNFVNTQPDLNVMFRGVKVLALVRYQNGSWLLVPDSQPGDTTAISGNGFSESTYTANHAFGGTTGAKPFFRFRFDQSFSIGDSFQPLFEALGIPLGTETTGKIILSNKVEGNYDSLRNKPEVLTDDDKKTLAEAYVIKTLAGVPNLEKISTRDDIVGYAVRTTNFITITQTDINLSFRGAKILSIYVHIHNFNDWTMILDSAPSDTSTFDGNGINNSSYNSGANWGGATGNKPSYRFRFVPTLNLGDSFTSLFQVLGIIGNPFSISADGLTSKVFLSDKVESSYNSLRDKPTIPDLADALTDDQERILAEGSVETIRVDVPNAVRVGTLPGSAVFSIGYAIATSPANGVETTQTDLNLMFRGAKVLAIWRWSGSNTWWMVVDNNLSSSNPISGNGITNSTSGSNRWGGTLGSRSFFRFDFTPTINVGDSLDPLFTVLGITSSQFGNTLRTTKVTLSDKVEGNYDSLRNKPTIPEKLVEVVSSLPSTAVLDKRILLQKPRGEDDELYKGVREGVDEFAFTTSSDSQYISFNFDSSGLNRGSSPNDRDVVQVTSTRISVNTTLRDTVRDANNPIVSILLNGTEYPRTLSETGGGAAKYTYTVFNISSAIPISANTTYNLKLKRQDGSFITFRETLNIVWNKQREILDIQSDWNETDATESSFIKNKPTIPDLADALTDAQKRTLAEATVTKAPAEAPNIENIGLGFSAGLIGYSINTGNFITSTTPDLNLMWRGVKVISLNRPSATQSWNLILDATPSDQSSFNGNGITSSQYSRFFNYGGDIGNKPNFTFTFNQTLNVGSSFTPLFTALGITVGKLETSKVALSSKVEADYNSLRNKPASTGTSSTVLNIDSILTALTLRVQRIETLLSSQVKLFFSWLSARVINLTPTLEKTNLVAGGEYEYLYRGFYEAQEYINLSDGTNVANTAIPNLNRGYSADNTGLFRQLGAYVRNSKVTLSGTGLSGKKRFLFAMKFARTGGAYATDSFIKFAGSNEPLMRFTTSGLNQTNLAVRILNAGSTSRSETHFEHVPQMGNENYTVHESLTSLTFQLPTDVTGSATLRLTVDFNVANAGRQRTNTETITITNTANNQSGTFIARPTGYLLETFAWSYTGSTKRLVVRANDNEIADGETYEISLDRQVTTSYNVGTDFSEQTIANSHDANGLDNGYVNFALNHVNEIVFALQPFYEGSTASDPIMQVLVYFNGNNAPLKINTRRPLSHFSGAIEIGNSKTSLARLSLLSLDEAISSEGITRVFNSTDDYHGLFALEGGTETEVNINATTLKVKDRPVKVGKDLMIQATLVGSKFSGTSFNSSAGTLSNVTSPVYEDPMRNNSPIFATRSLREHSFDISTGTSGNESHFTIFHSDLGVATNTLLTRNLWANHTPTSMYAKGTTFKTVFEGFVHVFTPRGANAPRSKIIAMTTYHYNNRSSQAPDITTARAVSIPAKSFDTSGDALVSVGLSMFNSEIILNQDIMVGTRIRIDLAVYEVRTEAQARAYLEAFDKGTTIPTTAVPSKNIQYVLSRTKVVFEGTEK